MERIIAAYGFVARRGCTADFIWGRETDLLGMAKTMTAR